MDGWMDWLHNYLNENYPSIDFQFNNINIKPLRLPNPVYLPNLKLLFLFSLESGRSHVFTPR